MNYKELVRKTAREARVTQETARSVLDAALAAIEGEIENGGGLAVVGFGTLEAKPHKGHTINNPLTKGEDIPIPARQIIKFTAAPRLKDIANRGSK